jgi:hypothetical protein
VRGGGLSLVLLLARMEWNTPQGPRAPLPEFGEGLQAGTVGNVGGAKLTPAYLGAPPPGAPPIRVATPVMTTSISEPTARMTDAACRGSPATTHLCALPTVSPSAAAPPSGTPSPPRSPNMSMPVDHTQGESLPENLGRPLGNKRATVVKRGGFGIRLVTRTKVGPVETPVMSVVQTKGWSRGRDAVYVR